VKGDVVAGMIRREPDGTIFTNEFSGHFGQNWNDAIRKKFSDFMKKVGEKHHHEAWKK
jgi:hypothetical protein